MSTGGSEMCEKTARLSASPGIAIVLGSVTEISLESNKICLFCPAVVTIFFRLGRQFAIDMLGFGLCELQLLVQRLEFELIATSILKMYCTPW